MTFATPVYLLFAGAVWLVMRALRRPNSRKILLLSASLLFYALLDLRYLFLVIMLGALTYALGIAIGRGGRADWCAAAGIAAALATLAFYKYSAVWLPAFGPVFAEEIGGWVLPVGISFYTFQAVSYLVDVRRRRIEPVRNAMDFGLYMAFFPKIVAGPIVRPVDFFRLLAGGPEPAGAKDLPQIYSLFLRGLFKKVVIADALAGLAGVGFQAAAISGADAFPAPVYWRSFYLFAFQIYADFSGYTDIARATGRLLGIPLPENFNRPYAASSITEFWNRWHASLTQWFREYVFFPATRALLSSRRKIRPALVQTGTTIGMMALIGLWHGAGLPYLIWGLWHGALLAVEKRLNPQPARGWIRLPACLAVFHLVAAGWVLFRSESLPAAGRFFAGLFTGGQWFLMPECALPVAASAAAVWAVDALSTHKPAIVSSSAFLRHAILAAAAVMVGALWLMNWATDGGGQPFLYGNF
ncbi:MAG: MBOAT family protein [Anaerolineales bacterium]|nr:MBOAT family protein [Anaerolineales bacterium]